MNEDLHRPLVRLQLLAAGIAIGGLLLGTLLVVIGVTKIYVWSLTFNVGLLLLLFGLAGVRIIFLARELVRPVPDQDAKHRAPVEETNSEPTPA